jgi:hypothetical protein
MVTLIALMCAAVLAPPARAEDPDVVRPSGDGLRQPRAVSTAVARTLGDQLDLGHDWLYRHTQQWIADLDIRFASIGAPPIAVPLSPLRIGLFTDVVHTQRGFELRTTPDIEATLRLPNLEHRLRVFITSSELPEPPRDSTLERPPLRAGLRFVPQAQLDIEFGVHAKLWPSAFASLKWSPQFTAGSIHGYAFAKPYVESGLGFGVSGGIAFERFSDRWFIRSSSYANWVRNTSQTDWEQSFVAGYARAVIRERRYDRLATGRDLACGIAARMSVSGDRVSRATLYRLGVMVKRPVHGGWLYGYLEPLVVWDRDFRWHPDVGLRVGLDALFWGLSTPAADLASYCR